VVGFEGIQTGYVLFLWGAAAFFGILSPGASIYAATKHAVEGLTKTAALEAASANVRVNAVAPGPIDTGMLDRFTGSAEKKAGLIAGVPLKCMGRPEEVAQVILFLASNKAPFVTGQIFGIDGGKMA
jgi:NAD(P)-dependent dehydrogenase (short-subunit alcohol dehydrogenase family)